MKESGIYETMDMFNTNHEGVSAEDIVEVTLRWESQAFEKIMEGEKEAEYEFFPNPDKRPRGPHFVSLQKDLLK